MSRATGKSGRPKDGDDSGEMQKISFRIDAETERALTALEARLEQGVLRGRRSALLRKLILEAFQKLPA